MDGLRGGGSGGLGALTALLGGGSGSSMQKLLPHLLGMVGGSGGSGSGSGLASLVSGFQSGGLGDIVDSWVGSGPNKSITPEQVRTGIGPDAVAKLASQSGMPEDVVAKHLTTLLPAVVNHLTPQASVPPSSALGPALQGLQALLPKT